MEFFKENISLVEVLVQAAAFLIVLGVLMFVEVWQLIVVYFLFFFVCYGPILFAEENFLKEKFGAAFEAWRRSTPAMIPNFKLWKAPRSTFSLKKVLRRESGLMLLQKISQILKLAIY